MLSTSSLEPQVRIGTGNQPAKYPSASELESNLKELIIKNLAWRLKQAEGVLDKECDSISNKSNNLLNTQSELSKHEQILDTTTEGLKGLKASLEQ